ncbi:hypothetical protein LBMAG56_52220 [Verrucomicrobiota bacterium]|nr:hypothetical protein LBMAG56_52220 [Verrucomicrobiota bacterium]
MKLKWRCYNSVSDLTAMRAGLFPVLPITSAFDADLEIHRDTFYVDEEDSRQSLEDCFRFRTLALELVQSPLFQTR